MFFFSVESFLKNTTPDYSQCLDHIFSLKFVRHLFGQNIFYISSSSPFLAKVKNWKNVVDPPTGSNERPLRIAKTDWKQFAKPLRNSTNSQVLLKLTFLPRILQPIYSPGKA